MKSFGITDIGKKRKVNQDYLFYSDEPVGCFQIFISLRMEWEAIRPEIRRPPIL